MYGAITMVSTKWTIGQTNRYNHALTNDAHHTAPLHDNASNHETFDFILQFYTTEGGEQCASPAQRRVRAKMLQAEQCFESVTGNVHTL